MYLYDANKAKECARTLTRFYLSSNVVSTRIRIITDKCARFERRNVKVVRTIAYDGNINALQRTTSITRGYRELAQPSGGLRHQSALCWSRRRSRAAVSRVCVRLPRRLPLRLVHTYNLVFVRTARVQPASSLAFVVESADHE